MSALIAALTVAMPYLKDKHLGYIADRYSVLGEGPKEPDRLNKFKLLGFYTLYSLLHIVTMMLIMTMNGWVDLFILAACMLTYFFLYADEPVKEHCCSEQ